ncbi:unnamed protein product [Spirodela intermedia]|uniref:Kinesin motor domain-containing protein n=1 Tax=Spirodela intermedia TaxID=51605 RepID=A0A7I8KS16_SPIIN|nr:unnamed protein product [Spirodela intermedia]
MKAVFHGRGGKAPPGEALTPNSHQKQRMVSRGAKENVDPDSTGSLPENRTPSATAKPPLAPKIRSPLHPRPLPNPNDTPLKKKKLNLETLSENGAPAAAATESGVQVIVRMRPLNKEVEEEDQIVHKVSADSVSILDHAFTFDSVADTGSTQEEVFQLVGLPLVENCLAGFNSSIFAYGQTGSGKTYTMWGPTSAALEDGSSSAERGLTPRVFERLFSRIHEEQLKHSDKQLNYQCRCSFLEIYNEQIMDLLDPSQRNLQIREDVRTGVYVDCLSEEYVCTMKDVTRLLTKGLANRRTGATSINAESSRSHCVFTCVIESHSKSIADGLNSLKISRINLVDLAGSERQKLTGAAGERLKEAGNINRSLSQLGNVINILAEVSQTGKQRHIPYRDSKLTFLLQESLGGNAKLAMICAISPSQSCKNESFSTLRFAQRAKAIKNKAIINEISQDDVHVLREQIRQLKDELLRMKANGVSPEGNPNFSTGWNARRSLNLLRMSLGQRAVISTLDDDMDIDEDMDNPWMATNVRPAVSEPIQDDVPKISAQCVEEEDSSGDDKIVHKCMMTEETAEGHDPDRIVVQSCEGTVGVEGHDPDPIVMQVVSPISNGADSKTDTCMNNGESYDLIGNSGEESIDRKAVELQGSTSNECKLPDIEKSLCVEIFSEEDSTVSLLSDSRQNSLSRSTHDVICDLSIVTCCMSPDSLTPSLSLSPKVEDVTEECLKACPMSTSPKDLLEDKVPVSKGPSPSFSQEKGGRRKGSLVPTEHLAASLQHGLQVISNRHQKSTVGRSLFGFSFKPLDFKPLLPIAKVEIGVQTVPQETVEDSSTFMCSYCRDRFLLESKPVNNDKDQQLVPLDDTGKKELQLAVENVLAGAIRREMALQEHCSRQTAEIVQLKRLIQQYKHERECNSIIAETREDKICRLENLMDGILPTEKFMEEEFSSLANEHKLLKEKYDNHPEVLRVNVELKRVKDELEAYRSFFDLGEREVLMEEIHELRDQLQYYITFSPFPSQKRSSLLQLAYLKDPIPDLLDDVPESTKESANENFEEERRLWAETESKWISLSEELGLKLEASRSLAEKLKMELDSEKKCSDELKEALQTAMQGHARILDQYADLQEKHIGMLIRHQQIRDGIEDVKRAAAKSGVKGAESKFINSLAAQISALKVEREKERQYWREENKVLQAQLRDTAEAVQAAGELVVRLKDAEEATASAQKRAKVAEKEAERAYQEIDSLKRRHEREIETFNQRTAESRLPDEACNPTDCDADAVKYDDVDCLHDQKWREAFEQQDEEFSRGAEQASWFSGYDQCNF